MPTRNDRLWLSGRSLATLCLLTAGLLSACGGLPEVSCEAAGQYPSTEECNPQGHGISEPTIDWLAEACNLQTTHDDNLEAGQTENPARITPKCADRLR